MTDAEAREILLDAARKLERGGKNFFMAVPEDNSVYTIVGSSSQPYQVGELEYIDIKLLDNGLSEFIDANPALIDMGIAIDVKNPYRICAKRKD